MSASTPDTETLVRPPPADWYPNPSGPGQRYWDGAEWTESYSPPTTEQPVAQDDEPGGSALVPLGYVFAVLILIVGLILGIIAATRPRGKARRHGPWIIALSAVVFGLGTFTVVRVIEQSNREATQRTNEQIQRSDEQIQHSQEQATREGQETQQKLSSEQHAREETLKREQQSSEERLNREQETLKQEQHASEERAQQELRANEAKANQEQRELQQSLREEGG